MGVFMNIGQRHDPISKDTIRNKAILRWSDPDFKEKQRQRIKDWWDSDEAKEYIKKCNEATEDRKKEKDNNNEQKWDLYFISRIGRPLFQPSQNYLHYYNEDGSIELYHRWVYKLYHGCDIPDGYEIHHINGNRFDNSYNNLEMLTIEEHRQKKHNLTEVYGVKNQRKALYNKIKQLHKMELESLKLLSKEEVKKLFYYLE